MSSLFFRYLGCLISLAALVACMKEPQMKADFGPEVSDEQVRESLRQVELPDPYKINAGEYSYSTRETWVLGRPYLVNLRWAYTVTGKTEAEQDYVITFVKELREYNQGQEKISQNETQRRLAKKNTSQTQSQSAGSDSSVQSVSTSLEPLSFFQIPSQQTLVSAMASRIFRHLRAAAAASPRITRHNLRFQIGSSPIPEFVKQRSNCGGLAKEKCSSALKIFTLSFDQVTWDDGAGGQRYNVSRTFSPDVPYFASTMLSDDPRYGDIPGVIQACVNTNLPYQGQQIPITQCDEIKDFTFGHP